MKSALFIGRNPFRGQTGKIVGELTRWDGEDYYRIVNYDRMRPFFMSVVSSSDLWMFISSLGGLTAGRGNPDLALFPYATDDKIHDASEFTGSKTLVIAGRGKQRLLWEPFSRRYEGVYRIRRTLYKNLRGNKLIFEEYNADLGATFRYSWGNSDRFGFVRRAWLTNHGPRLLEVRLLDGLQNLMPCGAGSQFHIDKSTLLDAYKRSELLNDCGLGLFRLSSIPVDRPEPAESLRTTTVWSAGIQRQVTLLSATQTDPFRREEPLRPEHDVRGERGAYLVASEFKLSAGATKHWLLVADVEQSAAQVVALRRRLRDPRKLSAVVLGDVERGTAELDRIIAGADGLQRTARPLVDARHSSNVLFNVMRGGIFAEAYAIDPRDLASFLRQANRVVVDRHARFLRRLPTVSRYPQLVELAVASGDRQLERLCREYLPLTFSRRHGDPSRPWNRFSIAVRQPDGARVLSYEGNWRDLFQNWEALALSYPEYAAGMIARFASASTLDGYNPYRVTRDGLDWEVPDPKDPWAHIGYWGDHQVIYLLKLLEILQQHDPATLEALLTRDVFAYANVPYRIADYRELLRHPRETVTFDTAAEAMIRDRVAAIGADGKLVWDRRKRVCLVNLTEKLLVSILAKLTNFIPEAGIWLNTQRPEWNDANNALVGNGVSMVTLCYLRRHLAFCLEIFGRLKTQEISLSVEVAALFEAVRRILRREKALLAKGLDNRARKRVLDELGQAGSRYRRRVYAAGLSGSCRGLKVARLREFLGTALAWMDQTIDANLRPDGLYHAYNLIRLNRPSEISIRRLYEMLEGQVAVLSSGRLSAERSLEVLQALRRSAIYRADQHSYLLYPNRDLPRFTERNIIPARDVRRSQLLQRLLKDGDCTVVERDEEKRFHFQGSLTNAAALRQCLERLAARGYAALVRRETGLVLQIYERVFDHESFTGRSGSFFAYEGLGSIYWHMVSKLLLAAQESAFRAARSGASAATLRSLVECYYDIREGIGDRKAPAVYGAFPMDPYSHTPAHTGARQPGLTGQVKEDILCRLGELGVFVHNGEIHFEPRLLRREEFLEAPTTFVYYDVTDARRSLWLPKQSLAFTHCQVPIVYQLGRTNSLRVSRTDGSESETADLCLDAATSRSIFRRAGVVDHLILTLQR